MQGKWSLPIAAATVLVLLVACTGSSASPSPTVSLAGEFNVAVVTDVGTVNDRNFNEYSYLGATNAADAIGQTGSVPVFVPPDASQYQAGINSMLEVGYNVIVTVGFNLERDTVIAAKANPDVWFVGVDQNPCITAEGAPDPAFACAGNANFATILPNYILVQFQEDQPGYLAGIVAASLSETGVIGAIGGITLCAPCIRYIQGYELGAQSVNPDIDVRVAYVTESDFVLAFNDPVAGKAFGETFIQQTGADVVFQVAGKTGNGVLDAVCEAEIYGIGVDVDQFLSYPEASACIVTSAEKKLALAVEEMIVGITEGTATAGANKFNAANEGIGVSEYHDHAALISAETQTSINTALEGMVDGTLVTCPADGCGVYTPQ